MTTTPNRPIWPEKTTEPDQPIHPYYRVLTISFWLNGEDVTRLMRSADANGNSMSEEAKVIVRSYLLACEGIRLEQPK